MKEIKIDAKKSTVEITQRLQVSSDLTQSGQIVLNTNNNDHPIIVNDANLITDSSNNVGIGINSLRTKADYVSVTLDYGEANVALGNYTLVDNTNDNNIAIGHYALSDNSGNNNIAIGFNALRNNIYADASNNIAIGTSALRDNSGNNCIAIGTNALLDNSGSHNIAIGNDALRDNSGAYCVCIGENAGRSRPNTILSDQLFINSSSNTNDEPLIYGNFSSTSTGAKTVLIPNLDVSGNLNIGVSPNLGNRSAKSDNLFITIVGLPLDSGDVAAGQLYTQTAEQLGGEGPTKVLCIK